MTLPGHDQLGPGGDAPPALPHAPWCRDPHEGDMCFRDTSWKADPLQVSLVFHRKTSYLFLLVCRDGMPGATLDPVTAQALSAMLAFAAPSPPTAALGVALQRAAALAFTLLGQPEVGPAEGAINPWKSER